MTTGLAAASRVGARSAFARVKAAAIDRCALELRGDAGDEAIQRCMKAIDALDVRQVLPETVI